MSAQRRIWGIFDDDTAVAEAVCELRRQGLDFTLHSPVMTHALEHALADGPSPVRLFVLVGGTVGSLIGAGLCAFAALRWGLIVGGKPILSAPPFLVIAFELTLLFGALAGVAGLLVLSGLGRGKRSPDYRPELSVDRFALSAAVDEQGLPGLRALFERVGALDIGEDACGPGAAGKESDRG